MNIEKTLNRLFWPAIIITMSVNLGLSVHLSQIAPFGEQKVLFVPEPQYVERISGTFRNQIALAFYMKGAQELAYNSAQKVDLLLALFRLAVYLDPKLDQAAFLGGMVTPARAKDLVKAIDLLELARQRNPDNWRFPYWIGFNYLQLDKFEKAAEYYNIAAELPGALPFLKTASVHILSRGSNLEMALAEAERLKAGAGDDKDTNELMDLRIFWLKSMLFLEAKNREFKKLTGRYPLKLQELVESKLLPELPPDEFGEGFYLVNPGDPATGYMVRSDF
ncbi:MAG: tetratricopeptide repeat protein [Candidatus Rifleibacteriota bacterium]